MKHKNMIIDDRLYTVIGPCGFRKGPISKEDAFSVAYDLQQQMRNAGLVGEVKMYYRDGSEVDWNVTR